MKYIDYSVFSGCGINRNIVECKVLCHLKRVSAACVLIETLWNVKGYMIVAYHKKTKVLIETLWNVKRPQKLFWLSVTAVLIETLWNVK